MYMAKMQMRGNLRRINYTNRGHHEAYLRVNGHGCDLFSQTLEVRTAACPVVASVLVKWRVAADIDKIKKRGGGTVSKPYDDQDQTNEKLRGIAHTYNRERKRRTRATLGT